MNGCNTWSYRPYRPFFWDVGDIYICRIVPDENEIHLEWLTEDDLEYRVFCKERGEIGFYYLRAFCQEQPVPTGH